MRRSIWFSCHLWAVSSHYLPVPFQSGHHRRRLPLNRMCGFQISMLPMANRQFVQNSSSAFLTAELEGYIGQVLAWGSHWFLNLNGGAWVARTYFVFPGCCFVASDHRCPVDEIDSFVAWRLCIRQLSSRFVHDLPVNRNMFIESVKYVSECSEHAGSII